MAHFSLELYVVSLHNVHVIYNPSSEWDSLGKEEMTFRCMVKRAKMFGKTLV